MPIGEELIVSEDSAALQVSRQAYCYSVHALAFARPTSIVCLVRNVSLWPEGMEVN